MTNEMDNVPRYSDGTISEPKMLLELVRNSHNPVETVMYLRRINQINIECRNLPLTHEILRELDSAYIRNYEDIRRIIESS